MEVPFPPAPLLFEQLPPVPLGQAPELVEATPKPPRKRKCREADSLVSLWTQDGTAGEKLRIMTAPPEVCDPCSQAAGG